MGYHGAKASSKYKNAEENIWFQQEMATALANLSRVTANLATSNADISSLKSRLKSQINPTDKDKHRSKHGNYCWNRGILYWRDHNSAS